VGRSVHVGYQGFCCRFQNTPFFSQNSPMVMTFGFHFKRITLFYQKMSISLSIRTCGIWLGFKTFNNAVKLIAFSGKKFDSA
jgi:hypothetical protein